MSYFGDGITTLPTKLRPRAKEYQFVAHSIRQQIIKTGICTEYDTCQIRLHAGLNIEPNRLISSTLEEKKTEGQLLECILEVTKMLSQARCPLKRAPFLELCVLSRGDDCLAKRPEGKTSPAAEESRISIIS